MSMSTQKMVAATSAAGNAPAPPSSELSAGKNADIIPPQLHLDCGAVVSVYLTHYARKLTLSGGSKLGDVELPGLDRGVPGHTLTAAGTCRTCRDGRDCRKRKLGQEPARRLLVSWRR